MHGSIDEYSFYDTSVVYTSVMTFTPSDPHGATRGEGEVVDISMTLKTLVHKSKERY